MPFFVIGGMVFDFIIQICLVLNYVFIYISLNYIKKYIMTTTKSNKGIEFYAIEAVLKRHDEEQAARILSDFANVIYHVEDAEKDNCFSQLQVALMKIVEVGGHNHGIHRVIPIEDGRFTAEIEVVLQNRMRLNVKNDIPSDTEDEYALTHTVVTLHIPHNVEGPCGDLKCIIPWRKGGLELV